MAGTETEKMWGKSTEICNAWETPTYRKEEQSGYDYHPAQAKTWMLLVQHYGTILSMHMTSESELKKTPQTSLACKNTWKIWCKMWCCLPESKNYLKQQHCKVRTTRQMSLAFKISESCWVIKSRGVIPGYLFKYILYEGINTKKIFQLTVFLKDEEKKACFPSCRNTPFLSKASATTSLRRESYSLLPLLAVWWHHARSPRLHPQLCMRLLYCSLSWCWKAGNNYYFSCLAQGLFSRLAACFLFLKVNSLSCMPRRQRKEITKESKNWLETI